MSLALSTKFALRRFCSGSLTCADAEAREVAELLGELNVCPSPSGRGEVAERPIVQHWKCCVSEMAPGVRIPPSPHISRY